MVAKAGGLEVTKAKLSKLFGVSTTAVDGWIRRGCPLLESGGRNRAYRFNSADVHAWLVARAARPPDDGEVISLEESRKRKLAAEARFAELDLGAREGELVEIATVAELAEQAFSTIRLRFLAVPSKVAHRLAPLRTAAKCRRLLEDEFRDVLNELVDGGLFADRAVERDREKSR